MTLYFLKNLRVNQDSKISDIVNYSDVDSCTSDNELID